MKREIFILLIFVSVLFSISAQKYQDTKYFTKEIYVSSFIRENDTTIFLYEKGNYIEPHVMLGHGFAPRHIRTFYDDLAVFLQKEYPQRPDSQVIKLLNNIDLNITYNGRGEIRYYQYKVPPIALQEIPDLEQKLYNIITALKKQGLSKYELNQGAPIDSCTHIGTGFRPSIRKLWQSEN